ncbi:MAG: polyprenyl synthetase family protein [Armatimonadetes bacterium]|nr:polyprenyl synthetase family protein [Armatimonadota bacterium]
MLSQILAPIEIYLEKTRVIFLKACSIRAGNLGRLARLEFEPADFTLRPALVILSGGMFGPVTAKIIKLAAMFQFVYIASLLHNDISEDAGSVCKSKNLSNRNHFPILAGDYFYSKSFLILYETGLLKHLRTLSETIGELNKVSILKLKNPDDCRVREEYVKKDTASLFAWGCKIGAEAGGAGEQEIQNLYRYGFHLGMGTGLSKENIYPEKAAQHFDEAKGQLVPLPPGTARDTLAKLVDYLRNGKKDGAIGKNSGTV